MFESFSYCLCKCKHCLVFLALGVNEFVLFYHAVKIHVKTGTHICNI